MLDTRYYITNLSLDVAFASIENFQVTAKVEWTAVWINPSDPTHYIFHLKVVLLGLPLFNL